MTESREADGEAREWLPASFDVGVRPGPAPDEDADFRPAPTPPRRVATPPRPRPAKPQKPPPAPRRAARRRTPPTTNGAGNGRLDLNAATFEELRSAGLSLSQAARFIGQREQRQGLTRIDELDSFYGLPAELKRALKSRGRV